MMKSNDAQKRTRVTQSISLLLLCLALWMLAGCGGGGNGGNNGGGGQTAAYRLTDLGDLTPFSINQLGQIVGAKGTTPYMFSGGSSVMLGPPSGTNGVARRINDVGTICGTYQSPFHDISGSSYSRAALLVPNGLRDLGAIGGSGASAAYDINVSGTVVGSSNNHAFIWRVGSNMQDLGTAGGTGSLGWCINDAGIVAGNSVAPGRESHVVLWSASGGVDDIGTLGVSFAQPARINNLGHIVGSFTAPGGGHGFMWSDGGGFTDLGGFGCMSINNHDQVVGDFQTSEGWHAGIWKNGHTSDLNSMIPPGSSWVLNLATDINDNGQIVGVGTLYKASRGFLLTPTP